MNLYQRAYGRNLTLAACCVVLSALCVYAAGRYELERRENVNLRLERDLFRRAADDLSEALTEANMATHQAEQDTRWQEKHAQDLSRRLKHYEAAYPEPEAARRERTPEPYLIRSAGRAD